MTVKSLLLPRRSFLKSTAALGLAAGLPAWFVEEALAQTEPAKKQSANDKPNFALIGCGGEGQGIAKLATRFANPVAVCDVDSKHADKASHDLGGARIYKDFRKLLEQKDIDRLGKLTQITTILPAGPNDGPFRSEKVPTELDWDFWQGQTPLHDYTPKRCHVWFRYWLDYSGGTMTDWGAHHNDIALWGMGLDRSGPITVEGKRLVESIPGGYTAAAEYEVNYSYANGVQHRCLSTTANNIFGGVQRPPKAAELLTGVKFEGSEGWIYVTRGKIEASRPELLSQPLSPKKVELYVSNDHMKNFFDCVRSRKAPICDAEIGHRSVSVCHLGVIALRLGRKLRWDPEKEAFLDDKGAESYLTREMRKPWTYEVI